jgi:hypothetical protein
LKIAIRIDYAVEGNILLRGEIYYVEGGKPPRLARMKELN